MATDHAVQFTSGSPDTELEPLRPEIAAALAAALEVPAAEQHAAVSAVAASAPTCLQAWATLAELAQAPIDRYAFARVGYHRGLDSLRAAGWRGSGYVRWRHEPNRGFLRSLHALEQAAGEIGEVEEEQRCALFLRQLDPEWGSHGI
jgi:hypothetical protein